MPNLIVVLLLLLPAPLSAQIMQHHLVTLAGQEDEGLSSPENYVTRLRDGRWVTAAGSELSVYSPGGQWVRNVGQEGQGPGEWRRIMAVVAHGDSLVVYDRGNGRVTVLGPQLEHVRTFPLPAFLTEILPMEGGGFAISGRLTGEASTEEYMGRSLFLLDDVGGVRVATGEVDVVPRRATSRGLAWLTQDSTGDLWALHVYEPRLDQDNSTGERRSTQEFSPEWWETSFLDRDFQEFTPDHVPPSINVGHWIDGDRLVTLTNTPAEDWQAAFGDSFAGEGGRKLWKVDIVKLNRTVVEVRDLFDGTLRAHEYFPGPSLSSDLTDRGYRVGIRTDDLGLTFVDVYQLSIEE